MKPFVSLLVGLCLLFIPSLGQAEAGWTDYAGIAELVPTAKHYYEVKLPVKSNPSGCAKKVWFYQDYSTVGSEKMYAALLEGIQSGNQIRVYVTGKCNVNGYAEFTSVGITP